MRGATLEGMSGFDSPAKILIVLVIALVVLGPKRLPEMARSLGTGLREFRDEMSGVMHDTPATPPADESDAPPQQQQG